MLPLIYFVDWLFSYVSFCWIGWRKPIISLISQCRCAELYLLHTNGQKMCWCVHLCQSNLHVFKTVTAETATFLAQANLLGHEISSPATLDPDFASVEEKRRWMETMHFLLSLKTNRKLHYSVTHTWYRYMPQKGQTSRSANHKKQNIQRLADDEQTPESKHQCDNDQNI